ncbi:MAG: hypothetical protein R2752_21575 [Vicinamibacterales bacterium]
MKDLAATIGRIFRVGGWAPLFVFGVHVVLSRVFNAYEAWPHTDVPMHFAGGIAIAFFVSRCFQALPREVVRSSRLMVLELILVASLTTTAAVVWEFAEFACDQVFGSNIQRSLGNTMQDMALGMAGAVVVMIVRARVLDARPAELRAVAMEWLRGRAA